MQEIHADLQLIGGSLDRAVDCCQELWISCRLGFLTKPPVTFAPILASIIPALATERSPTSPTGIRFQGPAIWGTVDHWFTRTSESPNNTQSSSGSRL